jgi:hypothetical protein
MLTTLPPSCAVVMKCGNLNFLEPSGSLQACNGTAVPLPSCNWLEGLLAILVKISRSMKSDFVVIIILNRRRDWVGDLQTVVVGPLVSLDSLGKRQRCQYCWKSNQEPQVFRPVGLPVLRIVNLRYLTTLYQL